MQRLEELNTAHRLAVSAASASAPYPSAYPSSNPAAAQSEPSPQVALPVAVKADDSNAAYVGLPSSGNAAPVVAVPVAPAGSSEPMGGAAAVAVALSGSETAGLVAEDPFAPLTPNESLPKCIQKALQTSPNQKNPKGKSPKRSSECNIESHGWRKRTQSLFFDRCPCVDVFCVCVCVCVFVFLPFRFSFLSVFSFFSVCVWVCVVCVRVVFCQKPVSWRKRSEREKRC